jgi:hypothetical protein
MSESTEVKIGRLDERMKAVEGKLDQVIEKLDIITHELTEKYATKEELQKVEARAIKNRWIDGLVVAMFTSAVTFLVIDYIKGLHN